MNFCLFDLFGLANLHKTPVRPIKVCYESNPYPQYGVNKDVHYPPMLIWGRGDNNMHFAERFSSYNLSKINFY